MYKIVFSKKADKELSKLTKTDIKRVIDFLQKFSHPFFPNLDIKKLSNTPDFYRIRLGKIRIIFEINHHQKEIWIRKVGYRSSVYRF